MPKRTASRSGESRDMPLTLAPLSFEEALTGLLQGAPPKDDAPEQEPETEPPRKRPTERKPKRDDEGSE